MCGICGWAASESEAEFNQEILMKMTDAIKHRGPDGVGYFHEPGIAFGHRRLSILDIEKGGQPFFSPSTRYVIVYNGEIYNAPQLRASLLKLNYPFNTHCDTEVLTVLAEHYGFDFINMIEGIFAFALWDRKEKRMLLARDGLGVKPLIYRIDKDGIRFASEAKAIYQDRRLSWNIDPQALHHYLSLNYIPAPYTIYKEMRKLGQGESIIWKSGKYHLSRFWQPPEHKINRNEINDVGKNVHDLIYKSVKGQLQSDVPVGIFLSSGTDSAVVLESAYNQLEQKPKAYCVGFNEKTFDERVGAKETANAIGAELTEFILEPHLDDLLPKMAKHFDEPFADSSAVPVWELCRQSSKLIKVALSGEGGDEVFCGYEPYHAHYYAMLLQKYQLNIFTKPLNLFLNLLPASDKKTTKLYKLKRFLPYLKHDIAVRHCLWKIISDEKQKYILYEPGWKSDNLNLEPTVNIWQAAFDRYKNMDPISSAALADMSIYLPYDILVKVDISSMAHSLEVRVPLLDRGIVQYVNALPDREKIDLKRKKIPMRKAFTNSSISMVFNRPKQGFSIPASKWLKENLKELFMDSIKSEAFKNFGALRIEEIKNIYRLHENKKNDFSRTLWGILMLSLWAQCKL